MILEKWLIFKTADVALSANGPLFTVGFNGNGRLGDGTTISRSSPVQVGTLSWAAIDVGLSYTLAIRSDGLLFSWGDNTFGQLGVSLFDRTSKSSPVQIGSSSWRSISTKLVNSYAIRDDYKLFSWGNRIYGAVNETRGAYTWSKLNGDGPGAIRSDGALFMWGRNFYGDGAGGRTQRSSPVQIGTSSWNMIAADNLLIQHHIAIRSDGALFTWGENSRGSVGDGTTIHKSSAVQIGTSSWIFAASALQFSAAIRSDGALFMWGLNSNGQLGDGTTINKSSPIQIGTSSWSQISIGDSSRTLAIRSDGALFSWGNAIYGIGDGTTGSRSSPIQIGTSSWIMCSVGDDSFAALRSDNTAWAWGRNQYGEVGDGTTIQKSSAVQIGTSSWLQLRVASNVVLALRTDGRLFVWGQGFSGLGDGSASATSSSKSSPVQIGTSSWTQISNGGGSLHGILANTPGLMFGWGKNENGNVGNNTRTSPQGVISPVQIGIYDYGEPVQVGSSSWIAVSAGEFHSIGLRSDGRMFGWGVGGLVGDNTYIQRSSPVQIGTSSWSVINSGRTHSLAINNLGQIYFWGYMYNTREAATQSLSWTKVSGGFQHTLAIRSDGALFSWGRNDAGAAGINSTVTQPYPSRVGTSSWTQISAAGQTSAAIRSDGALFMWGLNSSGQLGDGTTISKSSPIQIGTSSWTQIRGSDGHVTAIRSGGSLFAWGFNSFGRLGDGTTTNKSSPVQIGTSSWSVLGNAPSGLHGVAIRSDGALFTWGAGISGRLGDGTTISKSSPIQIGTSSWTTISYGDNTVAAIRTDGALFTWAINTQGTIGDGTTISKSSPVQIGTSSWNSVSVGRDFVIATLSNNTLYGWGRNLEGQLGDQTNVSKSSPIQIGTNQFSPLGTGYDYSAVVRSDTGSVFTWGLNTAGQLGDGSGTASSQPIQIGAPRESPVLISNLSWSAISAGVNHNLAIRNDSLLFGWGEASASSNIVQGNVISTVTQIGSSSWRAISAGLNRNFAIDTANTLYVWGTGTLGELGSGATTFISAPTSIATDVSKIQTYRNHSAYIKLS
jgi:alpha-tubulin suppressor-like RCC1 family protein